jgi:hypothetical protein
MKQGMSASEGLSFFAQLAQLVKSKSATLNERKGLATYQLQFHAEPVASAFGSFQSVFSCRRPNVRIVRRITDVQKELAMRKVMLVLFTAIAIVPAAAAQEPAAWADKLFEGETTHDFGIVAKGAQLKHAFKITNIYKVPLDITEVRGSCGCVTAAANVKTLAPGASGLVTVNIDGRQFAGAKTVKVFVSVGPKFTSTATLSLSANARGDVAFTPGEIDFGNLQRGQTPTKTIDVEYTGTLAEWRVVEVVKSELAPFELKVENLAPVNNVPRRGYRLTATLRADAATGSFKQEVVLKTNNAATPMLTFNVVGNVQARLSVSPNPIQLTGLKVDESQTKKVFVRAARPFKILAIDGQGDGIQVEVANRQEATQVLSVSIHPTKAGPLRRQLTIRTDLDNEATTLIIEGSIEP